MVTFSYSGTSVELKSYEVGDVDFISNMMRFVITRAASVRTYRKSIKRRRSLSFQMVKQDLYETLLSIVQDSFSEKVQFTDINGTTSDVYIRAKLTATHSSKVSGNTQLLEGDQTDVAYVDFQLEVIYA